MNKSMIFLLHHLIFLHCQHNFFPHQIINRDPNGEVIHLCQYTIQLFQRLNKQF